MYRHDNHHNPHMNENMDILRIVLLFAVFLCIGGILIYRLFDLQIVNGAQTLEEFTLKIQKERSLPSTRGRILDRNGNVLAYNELAYNVTMEDVFETGSTRNENINETLRKLIGIIEENGDKINNDFSIMIDDDGKYAFTVTDTKLRRFKADVYGEADPNNMEYQEETATAEEMMEYLAGYAVYGVGKSSDPANPRDSFVLGEGYTKEEILQIVSIRFSMAANSYQKYIPTNIATDVSTETVAGVLENLDSLPGAAIAEDTVRVYEDSVYFSQILGYTGKISQEELERLNDEISVEASGESTTNAYKNTYILTDMVGKAGIEQTMETYLQGTKGSETVFVDNLGKVIETRNRVEAIAGNDVYLTVDAELTSAIYNIVEQKLAGILISKIINSKTYTIPENPTSTTLKIPIDDVYYALINNNVIDINHFEERDAQENEKLVYESFLAEREKIFERLRQELYETNTPYNKLSLEYQVYQSHIVSLLTEQGVIMAEEIDEEDKTYQAWKTQEVISLGEFLDYCITRNWINVSKLDLDSQYSDSQEVFQKLTDYIFEILKQNTAFARKVYKYLIRDNIVTGKHVCSILLEQEVISITEEEKLRFQEGRVSAYDFIIFLIENLYITPAQLALDPHSASVVVTNLQGEVLALVSYPSYDNNRLANSIDSEYYARLQSDLATPMWNKATQERTAPGSTYKMVSATAALEENIITTSSRILCRGIFDRFETNPYRCHIYPSAHGNMDMTSAIAHSCNSYFYEVGYQLGIMGDSYDSDLGIVKLAQYADLYGLTEKSGVEIEESVPKVSDDYSVLSAIGQGSNSFTTVGLARYVTTVANSGTCYQLSLLDKVTDSNGNLLVDYTPQVRNHVELSPASWDAIHRGMERVVANRTDYANLGIQVAGKTGTAEENKNRANHALFVSYAPADTPEITVTTRIAYGYTSSYAANMARDIYQYYYDIKDEDEIISSVAEVPDVSAAGGD